MHCRYDKSLFGQDLTWGGRWGAIDSLCEALFVNFFQPRSISIQEAQRTPAALRSSASASQHFFELFFIIFHKLEKFMFFNIFIMILLGSYTSFSNEASIGSETQSDRLSSMLSIRSCSFRATQHLISDATDQCSCRMHSEIAFRIQVCGAKLLISISPAHLEAVNSLSERK